MIKRELYMSRIRPFIGSELIKVMTGIRRCGKSVMMGLIQEELLSSGVDGSQIISINFENMSNAPFCTAAALHDEIIRRTAGIKGKVYLFFDEIQEVEAWEKCINSFRVELDCDIYITGSNAKLLSGELATYLAGRYVEFVIYPFSFAEFVELYHTIRPEADVRQCFNRYLTLGGMPYLANLRYDETASRQYLRDLFNSVELKDIVKRNNVRDVDMLERIIAYVTANIGTVFSSTAISKYLKSEGRSVAPETVLGYLKACTDAFLFYQVKRQDIQGKKILTVNEKYYVADHGVREAVLAAICGTSIWFWKTLSIWNCCAGVIRLRWERWATKKSILSANSRGKSCIFRWPICWLRRRPFSGSLVSTVESATTFPSTLSPWMSLI